MEWFGRIGLVLDVVGVLILFRFGWPQPEFGPGHILLEQGPTDEERRSEMQHRRMAKIGLCLVIAGFVGQIVSTFA